MKQEKFSTVRLRRFNQLNTGSLHAGDSACEFVHVDTTGLFNNLGIPDTGN